MKLILSLIVVSGLTAFSCGQQIKSYTQKELFPGQICADDGPAWEKLMIGDCPQGYNGIRNWAKQYGLLDPKTAVAKAAAAVKSPTGTWKAMGKWPYCNPCNSNQACYEFKPGVAKCVAAVNEATGQQFYKEGETCLDFSGGKKKWIPVGVNSVLYGRTCEWPFFSCNWDAKANNGTYTCQRVRDAQMNPAVQCYRAAGGRWWGGSDQWYAWSNGKFAPCGGPNTDYQKCEVYPACAASKPWPWAE